MRGLWGIGLLLLATLAQAGEGIYKRGDFEFSVAPVPGFVQASALQAQWPADAPGGDAPWRTWRFDEQVDWRGGAYVDYLDYAFEARSQSLLGEAGRFSVTFNPEYQRLLIHRVELRRDGRWLDRLDPERISLARRERGFEEDTADGQVTALLVLDDVRIGDVVRVAYTIDGSNPILAGQALAGAYFGWRNPMLEARLRVVDDAGTRFNIGREHGAPEAVLAATPDGAEVLLSAHAVAPGVDEKDYPAWYQPFPYVQVSRQRSWADVVAWALPLYPEVPGSLPADLESRLRQWQQLADDGARLKAAARAVLDEVRYFGVEMGENTHRPAAPADTWRRRRGDCKDKAYLLVTLLQRLGIRAEPALTSMSNGRAAGERVPSAYVFDHVIVRVHLRDGDVWVDATASQMGGRPRDTDLGAFGIALPIVAGIGAPVVVASPAQNLSEVTAVERFFPRDDAGEVRFEVSTDYRGAYADSRRSSIASERSEDRARRYADYYRKRFGDLRQVSAPVVTDDREANVLRIDEAYVLSAPLEDDGGLVRRLDVRADTIDPITALPPTMERHGPLHFARPGRYRHEVRVSIPARWKPKFGKEDQRIDDKAFGFSRSLRVEGGEALLRYDLEVRDRDIAAADTGPHLANLRRVRDELGASLRFEIPRSDDADVRARRLQELLRGVSPAGTASPGASNSSAQKPGRTTP
ncbi:MAG: DUF3857 and transglutaminase domain-containing protein [Luteimonas sp.]|nr:DUF3857 and transglutaminase domain-containing protein [Luteimonas sp.]